MNKVITNVDELIGNTPLLDITEILQIEGLHSRILAKYEAVNLTGSIKDRPARAMLDAARESGALKEGGTIIEATSGNMGIALSALAAARNYKMIIVMPDSMSKERIALIQAYGAQIILTPGSEGMNGSVTKAQELAQTISGSILASQFENKANPLGHATTTGPEIYESVGTSLGAFVAGVGTGGTITGTGTYLKSKNNEIKVIAVEPAASPVLTQGTAGPHKIQGIGANFVPAVLDREIIDEVLTISNEEAYEQGRALAQKGLLVGISAGANIAAALQVAKSGKFDGKDIVTVLPDTGERYLSVSGYLNNEQ